MLNIVIGNQYNPYLNLAVENSLFRKEETDTVTMFLWKNQQTVVIGANQNPFTECNVDLLYSEGGRIARRGTGGGAVYHDLGNLNFSFVACKELYDVRKQLSVIQKALQHFGLDTEISGRNDITYEGRKFSGNAFSFSRTNGLHHGTILIKTDGERLQKYLKVNPAKLQKHGVQSVSSRIINLSEVTEITSDTIIPHLVSTFKETYQSEAKSIDFNSLCTQEVLQTSNRIGSDDYLFGKWRNFNTKLSSQFSWGLVEIDLTIDEAKGMITDIAIASDSLDTKAIEDARNLLLNADIKTKPAVQEKDNTEIISDIVDMIYC